MAGNRLAPCTVVKTSVNVCGGSYFKGDHWESSFYKRGFKEREIRIPYSWVLGIRTFQVLIYRDVFASINYLAYKRLS